MNCYEYKRRQLQIVLQDVRAASVKALTAASVLTLSRALFCKLLGNLADIRHMWRFEALCKACVPSCQLPCSLECPCLFPHMGTERELQGVSPALR